MLHIQYTCVWRKGNFWSSTRPGNLLILQNRYKHLNIQSSFIALEPHTFWLMVRCNLAFEKIARFKYVQDGLVCLKIKSLKFLFYLILPKLRCFNDVCGTRLPEVAVSFHSFLLQTRHTVTEKWKSFLSGIGFISDFKSRVMNEAATATQTITKHCIIYNVSLYILNQNVTKQYIQMI